MELRIALALAEKLRRIFEKDDTYLTFPLGVAFPNRSLGFMLPLKESGLSALEQFNEKVAFSRLLNIVPDDSATFTADAGLPLWDRTLMVLRDAVFAKSGLSADEEQQLAEAIDFLADEQQLQDGATISVNSAALNRYYELKAKHDAATLAYLDEKITVETATGHERERLTLLWPSRQRLLQDAIDVAQDNWNNQGQAAKIKAAMQTRSALEVKKYQNLYRDAYESEIALAEVPDLNGLGASTYATFFSPSNIFSPQAEWNQLTLARTELDTLVKEAAPSLTALFGDEQGTPIESVTLEYANVVVIRPWFRPEFFRSRAWKFSDTSLVSDGATPRKGLIPGYITSMLVTRNIIVRRPAGEPVTPVSIPILTSIPITTSLKGNELKVINHIRLDQAVAKRFVRPQLEQAALEPAPEVAAPNTPVTLPTLDVATQEMAHVQPARMLIRRESNVPATSPAGKWTFTKLDVSKLKVTVDAIRNIQQLKYQGTAIRTPHYVPLRRFETPAPAPERYAFDGIIVLAYVCRRVPLSPNPDLSLAW